MSSGTGFVLLYPCGGFETNINSTAFAPLPFLGYEATGTFQANPSVRVDWIHSSGHSRRSQDTVEG